MGEPMTGTPCGQSPAWAGSVPNGSSCTPITMFFGSFGFTAMLGSYSNQGFAATALSQGVSQACAAGGGGGGGVTVVFDEQPASMANPRRATKVTARTGRMPSHHDAPVLTIVAGLTGQTP